MNKEELRNLDIESINVKLKDIFGIKPKYYLAGIYALLIIAILFFLFLYPGIRKNGTWTYINSSMPGSAVFVDGKYLGSTPGKFFIPKGMREITVRYPYFSDFSKTEDVKGRILFSLFAPRKATLDCKLEIIDARGLYNAGLKEAAAWGLIDLVRDSYQPYPVLSRTAAGLVASGNLALAESVKSCLCGAPFDLEATPNFKARIAEAGFPWPPSTIVRFPAKDW